MDEQRTGSVGGRSGGLVMAEGSKSVELVEGCVRAPERLVDRAWSG